MSESRRDREPDQFDKAAGEVLCEARGQMTQTELAERLGPGWSQKRISKIESGKQCVRLRDIDEIARALGKDPTEIFKEALARAPRFISE